MIPHDDQKRNGQVVHDVDRMTLQDQARVMAEINCLVIQSMDYIADLVDPNKRSIHAAPGFIGNPLARPLWVYLTMMMKQAVGCRVRTIRRW